MNNHIGKLIAVISLLALLIVSVVACVSNGNTENTDPATDAITTADEDDRATETKKPFKPIIKVPAIKTINMIILFQFSPSLKRKIPTKRFRAILPSTIGTTFTTSPNCKALSRQIHTIPVAIPENRR